MERSKAARGLRWCGIGRCGVRLCAAGLIGVIAAVAPACGPSFSNQYVEAKAAGHRAYGSGRYVEAAEYFHAAAMSTDRTKQRDDLLYLEAAAYQRHGDYKRAQQCLRKLLELSPKGRRAATATYEIARIEVMHGKASVGWKWMHDFIVRYPGSGLARNAVKNYLEYLDEHEGPHRAVAYLEHHHGWYESHGLGELSLYHQALRLEKLGRLQQARNRYVMCASRYPYPDSTLFDDALYRASLLDEKLGRPDLAIKDLRDMLRFKEKPTLIGTYQRRRYSDAQMRIAQLYRDVLGDLTQGRKEFRKFYEEFPNSIQRDDALWQEALLAHRQQDRDGACDAIKLLVKKFPQSRYVPCATLLCESAQVKDEKRECREYVRREAHRKLSE